MIGRETLDLNKAALYKQYRSLLSEGIVPFWMRHGVDRRYGGVLSCMHEDGAPINSEKYTWSQARFVWTLSALYNRFERRPEFLEHARNTIDFLLRHARDEQGRFVYRTTREGKPLEGATSIYADCFAVYGISEYCPPRRTMRSSMRRSKSSTVSAAGWRSRISMRWPPTRYCRTGACMRFP